MATKEFKPHTFSIYFLAKYYKLFTSYSEKKMD